MDCWSSVSKVHGAESKANPFANELYLRISEEICVLIITSDS